VGSSEDNVGVEGADFGSFQAGGEREKRFHGDKEKREGKVFERARLVKSQFLTYKHNNIGFLWITDVNIKYITSVF